MLFLVRNWFFKELFFTYKLVLLIFFLSLSSEIMAKGLVLSKYQNSVLLIYDTINLKSERITIPVNSNAIYADLNLRVNSCYLLENNGYEFISSIEAGIKVSNTIEVKKHLELHSHKQYHNTSIEEGYLKIKLIECNNDDKIIINDIQG
jgi:hypothetical protein